MIVLDVRKYDNREYKQTKIAKINSSIYDRS